MSFLDASPPPSYFGVSPFEIVIKFNKVQFDGEDGPAKMKKTFWATDADAALHAAKTEWLEWMRFDYLGIHCSIVSVKQVPEGKEDWEDNDEY